MCSNEDILHKGGQLAPLYYLGYIYSEIQIYLFIQNVYFEINQKKIILSKQINLSKYCSTLLQPHLDMYSIYSIHKGGQLAPLYYLGYLYSQIQIYLFIQNVYFEINQKKIILSKQINLSKYCSTLLQPHLDTYSIYSILYTENIRAITKYLFFYQYTTHLELHIAKCT